MAFYGKKRCVHSLVYRKIFVEVYKTVRGATHCELDHEIFEQKCRGCGIRIAPSEVYLLLVSGNDPGSEHDSIDDAVEFAKAWIDEMLDGGPEDDDDEDLDLDPPKRRKENQRGKERAAGHPPGDRGKERVIAHVKKLKWGAMAIAMLRRMGKKPEKRG
jgi:hypothetical protein